MACVALPEKWKKGGKRASGRDDAALHLLGSLVIAEELRARRRLTSSDDARAEGDDVSFRGPCRRGDRLQQHASVGSRTRRLGARCGSAACSTRAAGLLAGAPDGALVSDVRARRRGDGGVRAAACGRTDGLKARGLAAADARGPSAPAAAGEETQRRRAAHGGAGASMPVPGRPGKGQLKACVTNALTARLSLGERCFPTHTRTRRGTGGATRGRCGEAHAHRVVDGRWNSTAMPWPGDLIERRTVASDLRGDRQAARASGDHGGGRSRVLEGGEEDAFRTISLPPPDR